MNFFKKKSQKYASITDYHATYANYFAHQPGARSYHEGFPSALLTYAQQSGSSSLLDISGGNGELCDEWSVLSANPTVFTDIEQRDAGNFVRLDLSRWNSDAATKSRNKIGRILGEDRWITTCLDVVEHIDKEHLPSLLCHLNNLTDSHLVVSVSTRPSSAGNRFHCTVLPIETWERLFKLAGFEVLGTMEMPGQSGYTGQLTAAESLSAVSIFVRANPFRDSSNYQHYLKLKRVSECGIDRLSRSVSDLLSLESLSRKRELASCVKFPRVHYHLHFLQDWSFLRSLMDVIPSDKLTASIEEENFLDIHTHVLKNHLGRCGVDVVETSGRPERASTIMHSKKVFITATEGPRAPFHARSSLVADRYKKRGWHTVTVQHGCDLPDWGSLLADRFGCWDSVSYQRYEDAPPAPHGEPLITGNPKYLDLTHSPTNKLSAKKKLSYALGEWVLPFERRVVIGVNRNLGANTDVSKDKHRRAVMQLARDNPRTLFVLKPHVDAIAVYLNTDVLNQKNIVLIDDSILMILDLSLLKLLSMVDKCITTPSTLAVDAVLAGCETCVLTSVEDAAPSMIDLIPKVSTFSDAIHRNHSFDSYGLIDQYLVPARKFYSLAFSTDKDPVAVSSREYVRSLEIAKETAEVEQTHPIRETNQEMNEFLNSPFDYS